MSKLKDIFSLKKRRNGPVDINSAINIISKKNKFLPSDPKNLATEISKEMKVDISEQQVMDAIFPSSRQLEEDAKLIYKNSVK